MPGLRSHKQGRLAPIIDGFEINSPLLHQRENFEETLAAAEVEDTNAFVRRFIRRDPQGGDRIKCHALQAQFHGKEKAYLLCEIGIIYQRGMPIRNGLQLAVAQR